VAVDPGGLVDLVVPDGPEFVEPALGEGQQPGSALRRQIRPAIVPGVHPQAGGVDGMELAPLGEERVDARGEVGHRVLPAGWRGWRRPPGASRGGWIDGPESSGRGYD